MYPLVDKNLIRKIIGRGESDNGPDVWSAVQQAITMYLKAQDDNKINKYNVEAMRKINGLTAEYRFLHYCSNIMTSAVLEGCRNETHHWGYFQRAKTLRESIAAQNRLLYKMRNKLKKSGICKYMAMAINKDAMSMQSRAHDIRTHHLWYAFDTTPYFLYKRHLERQGIDMLDDMKDFYDKLPYDATLEDIIKSGNDYLTHMSETIKSISDPEGEQIINESKKRYDENLDVRREKALKGIAIEKAAKQLEKEIADTQIKKEILTTKQKARSDVVKLHDLTKGDCPTYRTIGNKMRKRISEDGLKKVWVIACHSADLGYDAANLKFVSSVRESRSGYTPFYTNEFNGAFIFTNEEQMNQAIQRAETEKSIACIPIEFTNTDLGIWIDAPVEEQQEEYVME